MIHIVYDKNKLPIPIAIYSLKNVIELYTNYDISKNKIKIEHNDSIIYSKNVIRCVICNLKEFSNISNSTFYIQDMDELQIISE